MGIPAKGRHHKRRSRLVHKKPPKLDSVRNDINVTPLVDVCLVLLIIFMVIINLLARGKEVPLPETRDHQELADSKQPIVAVDREGQLYFDREPQPNVKAVQRAIELYWQAHGVKPGTDDDKLRIFVKADERVTWDLVEPLLLGINELKPSAIDLATREIREAK